MTGHQQISIENYEAKNQITKNEETEKETQKENNFLVSQEGKNLKTILGDENIAIYNRIVSHYSKSENLQESINKTLSPENLLSLGLSFDNQEEILDLSIYLLELSQSDLIEDSVVDSSLSQLSDEGELVLSDHDKKMEYQQGLKEGSLQSIQANLGIDKQVVQRRISEEPEREKNRIKALDIFYGPSVLELFSSGDNEAQKQEDKAFFESDIVQMDLKNILGNCLIDIDVSSFEAAKQLQPKEREQLSNAINTAFDLQLSAVLDGKMNYSSEVVREKRLELVDIHTNPYEKLKLFEEIKDLVNGTEARGGEKQDTAFRNIKKKQKGSEDATQKMEVVKETLYRAHKRGKIDSYELQVQMNAIKEAEKRDKIASAAMFKKVDINFEGNERTNEFNLEATT